MAIVAVSGGFDPIHSGHARLISDASVYGNVAVILNSDEWLIRKKGYAMLSWKQRREILMAMRHVYNVLPAADADGTVCETLRQLKPTYFANGGDRTSGNTPELSLCRELGIVPLFGIGGEKISSSSELVRAIPKDVLYAV